MNFLMSNSEKHQSAPVLPVQKALVAMCALGTFLLIWQLLKYSAYGIDFTDESFYLVWIANPFLYEGSTSQFGFVYHPLYSLLGSDIANLRQANILITFGLAWIFAYVFCVSLAPDLKEYRITLLSISSGFATSSFIIFDSWSPTPSYNSLNLQALLTAATGLVLAGKNADRKSITGWLLIGVGGWMTFMAKPSTALSLAAGVFFYIFLARIFSIRMFVLSIACALVLLLTGAMLIDGSFLRFVTRLQVAFESGKILGGGHTLSKILRVDEFQLDTRFNLAISLVSGALFSALWSICAKNKKWQVIGLLISIAFFSITALLTLGQVHRTAGLGQFQGLLIFAVIYAAIITAFALGRLRALKSVKSQQWMIAALFLAMPHVYAFGTNGNYWEAGSSAAIFWLLAGLTLLGPLIRERASWLLLLPLAIATQAVTATLLHTGLVQPYRQPQPLWLNASTQEIGLQRSALMLSDGYSSYITSAMTVAKKSGLAPNTPIIDLSGQSPGILYAIGAENIGQPWMIGGYPGSLQLAQFSLEHTSCEKIAAAWVLLEKDGPRSIPVELLVRLGAVFPVGYDFVGSWQTAEGAGGYAVTRSQLLYKPVEQTVTLINCQNLRAKIS
jgi:hypothetical protein